MSIADTRITADTPVDRIDRERDFHNHRFSGETREAQGKYYSAIEHGARDYMRLVRRLSAGADVLEYGCATGGNSLSLAPLCRSMTGIDISDVAIGHATERAVMGGIGNASFHAMNAEDMTFPDASFDLVFGSGIIHHLDLDRCYSEISRVLRPGGTAVFWEPLGHNVLINLYRGRTPDVRTPDEHPLLRRDFTLARRHFGAVDLTFYGLLTLGSVPLRNTRLFRPVHAVAATLDRLLFVLPGLRWQAWYTLAILKAPS